MANTLMLKIRVDDKGNPAVKKLIKSTAELGGEIKYLGETSKKTASLTQKIFTSGALLYAMNQARLAISATTKEVIKFNETFKQVEGITGTTGKALDALKQKTLDVSNTTEHMSSEISQAVLTVSKMGFTLEQSLAVVPHVADLATASVTSLDDAMNVAVQTMKSFGLQATDMEHITNVIQGTVSKTAMGFQDYAEGMKFVAPIAKTMGISLEQTSAMMGKLADVGIKGSISGTTLKNMFLNIMKPSEDVRKIIENMSEDGLTFLEILKQLNAQNVPISSFLETFNKRAVAGSLALSELTSDVKALEQALLSDEIVVRDVANTIRDSWIAQLKILRNTFVNTFVVMGEILDQSDVGLGIEAISQRFVQLQEYLKQNPEVLINFAKDLASIAEVIANLASGAFEILIKNMDSFILLAKIWVRLKIADIMWQTAESAWTLGKNFTFASSGSAAFSMSLKTMAPVLTAIGLSFVAVNKVLDDWSERIDAMTKATTSLKISDIDNRIAALKEYEKQGQTLFEQIQMINEAPPSGLNAKHIRKAKEELMKVGDQIAKNYGLDDNYLHLLMSQEGVQKMITGETINRNKALKAQTDLADKLKESKFDIPQFKLPDLTSKAKVDVSMPGAISAPEFKTPSLPDLSGSFGSFDADTSAIERYYRQAEVVTRTGEEQLAVMKFDLNAQNQEYLDQLAKHRLDKDQSMYNELSAKHMSYLDSSLTEIEAFQTELDLKNEEMLLNQDMLTQQFAENTKDFWMSQADAMFQGMEMTMEIFQMFADRADEKMKKRHKLELEMLTQKKNHAIAMSKENMLKQKILMAGFAEEEKKLKDKQEQEEKDRRKKQKAMDIVSAIINTAVGITKTIANVGMPAAIPLTVLTAALGAVQIGMIASQDYRLGGLVTGNGNGTSDSVSANLSRGEYVLPSDTTATLGGASGVQQLVDENVENVVGNDTRGNTYYFDTVIGTEEFIRTTFEQMERERGLWVQS